MGILNKLKKDSKQKTEVKKEEKSKEKKTKAKIETAAHKVLLYPQISEKATYLAEENKYVFIVSGKASKGEIAQAIKDVYGIKPVSINTVNIGGKARRYGRTMGRTSGYKKAIVTLPQGETIQIYDGV